MVNAQKSLRGYTAVAHLIVVLFSQYQSPASHD
ncbi:hypothetical protein J2810_004093 [Chryseobacterium rhizosphaerae]|nr:hypothetical protein [Chryseobacterium rhizosphaerae]